ncbi:MAG: hypothetical protein HY892_14225 [Deltaproteobacteria bacterium]|nr:hypothetical protein [Deltaproteobacteria bacterium]
MRKNYVLAGGILVLTVLFSACATVDYSLDTAKESPFYGKIDKRQAAEIVMKQASPSGSQADSGTFMADAVGMSFRKTEKKKRTETRNNKPVQVEYQEVITRNVPWEAVLEIRPRHSDYGSLGLVYVINLVYRFTTLDTYGRHQETAAIDFYCSNSRERFVNVLAALRTLIQSR